MSYYQIKCTEGLTLNFTLLFEFNSLLVEIDVSKLYICAKDKWCEILLNKKVEKDQSKLPLPFGLNAIKAQRVVFDYQSKGRVGF